MYFRYVHVRACVSSFLTVRHPVFHVRGQLPRLRIEMLELIAYGTCGIHTRCVFVGEKRGRFGGAFSRTSRPDDKSLLQSRGQYLLLLLSPFTISHSSLFFFFHSPRFSLFLACFFSLPFLEFFSSLYVFFSPVPPPRSGIAQPG